MNLGLSQEALGARIHASQSAVAAWETERNEPSLAVIAKIAAATGATPEWLSFGHGLAPGETVMEWVWRMGRG